MKIYTSTKAAADDADGNDTYQHGVPEVILHLELPDNDVHIYQR